MGRNDQARQEGAELKAGYVGLVVMVNKYDGVDCPARHATCSCWTACRVRWMDATERREAPCQPRVVACGRH